MTRVSLLLALLLALAGCGDDTTPPSGSDGGPRPADFEDADNDTITNRQEVANFERDSDMDGTPDYLDTDSDNDGLLDALEAGDANPATPPRDSDEDGIFDFIDEDSDANGIDDLVEQRGDIDDDGIENAHDLDDDGDGFPDEVEIGPDSDQPVDTDGDRIFDFQDLDSDNDSIFDAFERDADTDGDGILDRFDSDSDDDGISDAVEAGDADLNTAPFDTDRDGIPDFRDPDSDNDGLRDSEEIAAGTDRTLPDSDNDGVLDFVEVAAGSDPTDIDNTPESNGDFVFLVPFEEDPRPLRRTLQFRTNIQFADVYFLFDNTGSMGPAIENVRDAVSTIVDDLSCEDFGTPCGTDADCGEFGRVCGAAGTCISDPTATGCIASLWTGTGIYNDPDTFDNLRSLQGNPRATQMALASFSLAGGAESMYESAACTVDGSLCDGDGNPGCTMDTIDGTPTVGCVAYRGNAVRILVQFTDEGEQSSSPVTPDLAARTLLDENVTFVGVAVETGDSNFPDAVDNLQDLARRTDSRRGDGSLLFYQGADSALVGPISDALREVATGIPFFVAATQRDLDEVALGVNTTDVDSLQFIRRIEVNTRSEGCTEVSSTEATDTDGDGFKDAIPFLIPGTPACWDVVPARNTMVEQTGRPQVYAAQVGIEGDDSPLDQRRVFFIVPPEPRLIVID